MKFKIIFILFNVVVVFSFLIVLLLPVIMLGSDYSRLFFSESWYFIAVFFAAIVAVDIYFFTNWRLFTLLENEDWKELTAYLEDRIYNRKKTGAYLARILANTYLLRSDTDSIGKLKNFLEENKPAVIRKMVLPLSVPVLVRNDAGAMEEYFSAYIEGRGVKKQEWIQYLYSFSLILNGRNGEAADYLRGLCERKLPAVLKLLVVYSLNSFAGSDDENAVNCVDTAKKELKKKYTRSGMTAELEKINDNIITLVLSKFSKEAVEWLYKDE